MAKKFSDISVEEWKKLSEEEQKNFKEVIKKTFLGLNKVSMENQTEEARSEKRKKEALKKNFDVMSGIWKQSKITSKAVKVVSNHWGKILGLAIFLLPKKFWTNLRETIYKIYDFFKGKTLSQIWTDLVDNHIGKIAAGIGILAALFAPGAAFMLAMSAFSTGMIALTTAKWFKEKLLPSNKSASPNKSTTPAGTKGTTTKKTDAPIKQTAAARATQKTQMRQTLNTAEKRQAALDRVRGSSPRTAPGGWASKFKTAGKVAGKVAARLSPIALVATPVIAAIESQETFRNEGFKKGMAHAIESVTWGLVPRKASETAINAAADGVKIAGTSITKGFINASDHIARSWNDIKTYDYKALLDPIKKQIVDKKKQAMRSTKIPRTMSSLDFADDAQKERLRGRIEKAEQKMLQAKGSKDKAAAGLKLQALKNELANYGKGPAKTPIVTMGSMSKAGWADSDVGSATWTANDTIRSNVLKSMQINPALAKTVHMSGSAFKNAGKSMRITSGFRNTEAQRKAMEDLRRRDPEQYAKNYTGYRWNKDMSLVNDSSTEKWLKTHISKHSTGNAIDVAYPKGIKGNKTKQEAFVKSLNSTFAMDGDGSHAEAEGDHIHINTGQKKLRNNAKAFEEKFNSLPNTSGQTLQQLQTQNNALNGMGSGGGTTVIAPTTNNNSSQATTAVMSNPNAKDSVWENMTT